MVSILKFLPVYMYLDWKLKNTQEKVSTARKEACLIDKIIFHEKFFQRPLVS